MSYDSIQIVIPVYNEGENIRKTLQSIEDNVGVPFKIFIIYDFDEDTTVPVISKYSTQNTSVDVTLIKNRHGRGALAAIRTGFDVAEEGAVLVVMADFSDDISVVDSMLERINNGYDIVCGSRYMKGGRQVGGPKIKKLISRTIGLSLHLLTGLPTHDITNSFKMYRKSVLQNIEIESSGGFEIGMEIVAKSFLRGYKITEVPSTWHDRAEGESRFKLMKWAPGYFKWYLYALKGRWSGLPSKDKKVENA